MLQLDRRTSLSRGACALLLGTLLALSCNEYDPSKASSTSGGSTSKDTSLGSGGSDGSETKSSTGEDSSSGGDSSSNDVGGSVATDAGAAGSLGIAGTGATAGTSDGGGAPGLSGAPGVNAGNGGVAGANAVSVGVAGRSNFHVFLLLGQSNMAGYPKAQAADRIGDPRVRVLGYDSCSATGREVDQWATATPPLHSCWSDAIGPGDYFAKAVLAALPSTETVGLVPCAISGEKIETFMKGIGAKYTWIVSRAKLAQQAGGVIDGILFHQGESNNGDTSWPTKVNTLVTDLRTDLGLGEIPFLAGELLYSGSTAGQNTQINMLPSVVKNAYVISANGLVVDPTDLDWKLHFDHDSQVTFGKRYAQTMLQALKW